MIKTDIKYVIEGDISAFIEDSYRNGQLINNTILNLEVNESNSFMLELHNATIKLFSDDIDGYMRCIVDTDGKELGLIPISLGMIREEKFVFM